MGYPRCEALLRDGSRCRSVVASTKGDEPFKHFCLHHAKQAVEAAEAKQAASAEADPLLEDEQAVEDAVEDALLEVGDPAEVVSPRGTPRETIREFALANPHLVDEFLKGVLASEQSVWLSCPSCKKRSEVGVPNWSARTKAVELLLEQGFGRPEPAPPPDGDEKIRAAIADALRDVPDEKLVELLAPLEDFQRAFLARPLLEQVALSEADEDEVALIAERHGYTLTPA